MRATIKNFYNTALKVYVMAVEVKGENSNIPYSSFRRSGKNYEEVRAEVMECCAEDRVTTIEETYEVNNNGVWTKVEKF